MPLGHILFGTISFLMTQWRFTKHSYAVLIVVDMSWFESYRSSIKNHLLLMILKDLTSVHCYESA